MNSIPAKASHQGRPALGVGNRTRKARNPVSRNHAELASMKRDARFARARRFGHTTLGDRGGAGRSPRRRVAGQFAAARSRARRRRLPRQSLAHRALFDRCEHPARRRHSRRLHWSRRPVFRGALVRRMPTIRREGNWGCGACSWRCWVWRALIPRPTESATTRCRTFWNAVANGCALYLKPTQYGCGLYLKPTQ